MSNFLRGLKRKVYEILHKLEVESVQIHLFLNDGNIKILASVQIYFQVFSIFPTADMLCKIFYMRSEGI